MNSPIKTLEPTLVWNAFDDIRRIPRPSKKEEKIVRHVLSWSDQQDFSAASDGAGNLVIRVPATPGFEAAPVVILQAHLDMVCEKNAGVEHDFDHDPIDIRCDGQWVRAEGTTLGADNGIGVALAMATAVDPQLRRGPLELLFTLDEETGLNGAKALDGSMVSGRTMINLDAEVDDGIFIGCAGAAGVRARLNFERQETSEGEPWMLSVRGLLGGHSGMEIDRGRGNAISILARILAAGLDRGLDPGLISLEAGDKANAIPREAFAALSLTSEAAESWRQLATSLARDLREQLGSADPGLEILFEVGAGTSQSPVEQPLTTLCAARWLRLLNALPHGPIAMSQAMPGLVETSVNLALVRSLADHGSVLLALRSSSNPALDGLGQQIASLVRVAGAEVERIEGYTGWQPQPNSPLVRQASQVYERLFDVQPELMAVHAGLECGVLARRIPGLRAISIGPVIEGPHSPDEKVSVASVAKIYRWLCGLLEELQATA